MAPAVAQQITGEIDGTVRDRAGAVIVNAQITVVNLDTNETVRTLKTNKSGDYAATTLQVGTYKITCNYPGFVTSEIADIGLAVGDTLTKDFSLNPGASDSISIVADTEKPNIETNENASLIDNKEIQELALNTRNFEQMLLLQPGVSYGGPDELNVGQVDPTGARNSHQLSVNGLQPSQVTFLLDGADILNHTSNLQVSLFPAIDSIQQIQTVRNNYGAQYGGGGSAQVELVTKAGGAAFHGDAYYFFRHEALAATPVFDLINGIPKPPIRYNDFGYTLGGPLFIPRLYPRNRSKTFFFVSQEFRRLANTFPKTFAQVPTLAEINGYFVEPVCLGYADRGSTVKCSSNTYATMVTNSPYPGSNYHITSVDPIGAAYVKDVFTPLITQGFPSTYAGGPILLQETSTTSETQELVRLDQQFSERLNAFFRYVRDPFTQQIPYAYGSGGPYPTVGNDQVQSIGSDYLGHVTWVARPTVVVEAGFSYLPSTIGVVPTGTALASNSPDINVPLPFANTTGRIPTVELQGSPFGSSGSSLDSTATYQIFENTTKTIGKHVVYIGGNFEHVTDTSNAGTNNAGIFNFNATNFTAPTTTGCIKGPTGTCNVPAFDQEFAQLLTGSVTTFTQASVDPVDHVRQNVYEAYIQDVWRATATLTLNLGVRYSVFQAPGDYSAPTATLPQGRLGGFQPEAYNVSLAPTIGIDGTECLNNSPTVCSGMTVNTAFSPLNGIVGNSTLASPYSHALSNTPFSNVAPRVGFAWNVFGDGKTSLRGGFGLFYDQQPLSTYQGDVAANPAYVQNPVYTDVTYEMPTKISTGAAAIQAIGGVSRQWKQPYVEAFNLDLQQQLRPGMILDVGYVGNNTVHLQGEEDLNQPQAGLYIPSGVTNYPTPCTGSSLVTVNGASACYPVTASSTQDLNRIRPYLGWGPIEYQDTRYFSDYSGLQVSFLDRIKKSLTLSANYTWSKAMANDGGPTNLGSGVTRFDPQDRFNLQHEWGLTLLDRRNMFVSHLVYELPSHSSLHGFTGQVLNGWEVAGIFEIVSGLWWTASEGSYDPGGQGGLAAGSNAQLRPDLTRNPNNYLKTQLNWFRADTANINMPNAAATWQDSPPGGHDGGNEHVGAILGPGYQSYNLSLYKNFELPGTVRFQLRFEAFNLPNHVNWRTIGTDAGQSTFGTVTSAYDNREIQVGAKLTF